MWKKDVGPFILLSFVGRIHLTLESFTFHQKTFVGLEVQLHRKFENEKVLEKKE